MMVRSNWMLVRNGYDAGAEWLNAGTGTGKEWFGAGAEWLENIDELGDKKYWRKISQPSRKISGSLNCLFIILE